MNNLISELRQNKCFVASNQNIKYDTFFMDFLIVYVPIYKLKVRYPLMSNETPRYEKTRNLFSEIHVNNNKDNIFIDFNQFNITFSFDSE